MVSKGVKLFTYFDNVTGNFSFHGFNPTDWQSIQIPDWVDDPTEIRDENTSDILSLS